MESRIHEYTIIVPEQGSISEDAPPPRAKILVSEDAQVDAIYPLPFNLGQQWPERYIR